MPENNQVTQNEYAEDLANQAYNLVPSLIAFGIASFIISIYDRI